MNAPQPEKDGRRSILELNRLIAQNRSLFHDLEQVSGGILARDGLLAQERRLMMGLRQYGPCTVPQLARKREFSRQYVQTTMNELAGKGMVVFGDNPDHKRSRLMELTSRGEETILKVMAAEGEVLKRVAMAVDPDQVRVAVEVLREVRERLASAEV